jgi:hypothetical protein
MQYAQLNPDGTYSHQITTSGNVLWDQNNFCSAEALVKDGKASQFYVVELHETDAPETDPMTQIVMRDGGEFVNGRWQYHWRVDDLTPEHAAHKQAEKKAQLQASIVQQAQKRIDDFANTRNYAGIMSACTYVTSTVPEFAAEGQYCVEARDATWSTLYAILADVQAGTRPVPTSYAEIEPELPALAWPD